MGKLLCSRNFLISKSFLDKNGEGGINLVFRHKFFDPQYEKASKVEPSAFQKLCGIEKFYLRERVMGRKGISRFCVNKFVSHSTEKFRKGNLCFKIILVPIVFGKVGARRRESRFSVEILSHSTKKFRTGILLCFRKNLR